MRSLAWGDWQYFYPSLFLKEVMTKTSFLSAGGIKSVDPLELKSLRKPESDHVRDIHKKEDGTYDD
jgi:hypothetical protein